MWSGIYWTPMEILFALVTLTYYVILVILVKWKYLPQFIGPTPNFLFLAKATLYRDPLRRITLEERRIFWLC